jgi:hypothetical protein
MNQKVKEITSKLESNVKEMFVDGSNYIEYLKWVSKFHKYSSNNIRLIMYQFPSATHIASFKDWKKLNRFVSKGQKGIKILVPTKYGIFRDDKGDMKLLSKATKREKLNIKNGSIKVEYKLTFKIGHVFDVSQTTGEEIPTICDPLIGDSDKANKIVTAIKNICDIPVKIKKISSGAKGYYSKSGYIALSEDNEGVQNAKTIIHEYAHYKLHSETSKSRGMKEVEAESVAYVVTNYFDLDTSSYSFEYIASWSNSKELKELKESLSLIQKTANEIINGIENFYTIDSEAVGA